MLDTRLELITVALVFAIVIVFRVMAIERQRNRKHLRAYNQ